jgi:hypothetical protein
VKAAEEPLEAVRAASDKRDPKAFDVAFANLTTACNACHQAAGLDFIRIRTPSSAPFSNQDFTPARR